MIVSVTNKICPTCRLRDIEYHKPQQIRYAVVSCYVCRKCRAVFEGTVQSIGIFTKVAT